jgi:hypothetical protein
MINSEEANTVIQKPKLPESPEIKLHEKSLSRTMIIAVFVGLILITGYTLTHLDTAGVQVNQAFKELATTLNQMFLQPNAGTDGVVLLLQALGNSLLLSIFDNNYRGILWILICCIGF